jgi:hypothetical protein
VSNSLASHAIAAEGDTARMTAAAITILDMYGRLIAEIETLQKLLAAKKDLPPLTMN